MDKKKLNEALAHISSAKTLVEEERDNEQEKFDNKSENAQSSETGQKQEEKINYLNEVCDALDTADSNLNDALNA